MPDLGRMGLFYLALMIGVLLLLVCDWYVRYRAEIKDSAFSGKISRRNAQRDLQRAIADGHLLMVDYLIVEKRADVNKRDEMNGFYPLMYATLQDHPAIVALLLNKGADVNARNRLGWTALMAASDEGHASIVKILLDKNADVEAKTPDGRTALDLAVERNHADIVEILREKKQKRQLQK